MSSLRCEPDEVGCIFSIFLKTCVALSRVRARWSLAFTAASVISSDWAISPNELPCVIRV